jgi:hypothetical protein
LKTADKEKLKALPPVEDVDPDGGAVATIVEDSDDDEPVSAPVVAPVAAPVVKVEEKAVEEPVKKKIVRKKTDA